LAEKYATRKMKRGKCKRKWKKWERKRKEEKRENGK
jgi:RNA-splicing ligase RtcB